MCNFVANELFRHLQHGAVDQKRTSYLRLRDDLSDGAEDLIRARDDWRHRFADALEPKRRGERRKRAINFWQRDEAQARKVDREREERIGRVGLRREWRDMRQEESRPKISYAQGEGESKWSEINFRR